VEHHIIMDYSFYYFFSSSWIILSTTTTNPPRAPDSIQFEYEYEYANTNTLPPTPPGLATSGCSTRPYIYLKDRRRRRLHAHLARCGYHTHPRCLDVATIPILGALVPNFPDEEPLVAFPMILPMGWIDSPQYFCTVMETIVLLENLQFHAMDLATTTHRLDKLADTLPLPITGSHWLGHLVPQPFLGPICSYMNMGSQI
jgi:hypothetical protein